MGTLSEDFGDFLPFVPRVSLRLPLSVMRANLSPDRDDEREAGAERQTTLQVFTALVAVLGRMYTVSGCTLFVRSVRAGRPLARGAGEFGVVRLRLSLAAGPPM